MKTCTIALTLASGILCSTASASVLVSAGQTQASVDALLAAGYTDITNGTPYISVPQGDCASIGCMSFISVTGDIPLKGFYQFKFLDFTTVNYSGLFGWLQFNYGTSGITQQDIINSVNAQAGATGVYAMRAQDAGHPDCHFSDFLPPSMTGPENVFFNWYPTPAPNTNGLSQLFTFAWDFSNYAPGFTGSGLSISGAGSVPAPGALALLGFAGRKSRRRQA
jgi:hypothetical protein